MAHEDLDAWLVPQEKKASWLCTPKAVFPKPGFLGQEPPLLAALRGAYVEQEGSSDCSLTSVTVVLNALLRSKGSPVTRENVLALAGGRTTAWREATRDGGSGVKFGELVDYARAVFERVGCKVTEAKPRGDGEAENKLRDLLCALSSRSALILYVDQGVFTGTKNVPHVTPVAAYHGDGVLLLEVDGELPSLYLSPVSAVMEAMNRAVDDKDSALFGQSGGWLHIERR
jgi:hypothetical protein